MILLERHKEDTSTRKKKIRKEFAEKQHESRKAWLRERDVSTQTADLLPVDPDADMPTPIALELESSGGAQKNVRNTRHAKCRGPASRESCGRASPSKERWASPNDEPTAAMQQR